jgi:hypothetical protein
LRRRLRAGYHELLIHVYQNGALGGYRYFCILHGRSPRISGRGLFRRA